MRAYREEDLLRVLALANDVSRAAYGEEELDEAILRTWLTTPGLVPERDIRVLEREGELAGVADVFDQNGLHTRYWCDVSVHPNRGSESAADALVGWCEERVLSDAEPGAFLRAWVGTALPFVGATLAARGYEVIRSSFRMRIDLAEERTPRWPEGIGVRTMAPGESRLVYEVHEECFADHWEHVREPFEEWKHWTTERDGFDPELCFLAVEGDEVAGYSLCRPHEAEPGVGWVSLLGVRRPWRRRGLGEALLLHSFEELRRRDLRSVVLGVDADSLTGATRLYERVGMRVVRHAECYEKRLAA